MSPEIHNFHCEAKRYITVFVALLALTAITVAVSGLKTGIALGIMIALVIATVKGTLVAWHFMHLAKEKRAIYFVLILTGILLICLIALICIFHHSVPEGLQYVS